jgi:hypothetical protein
MSERDAGAAGDSFASSRHCFEAVLGFLEGEEACGFEHGELEEHLERQSRELFRRLFQDHLVIRSQREERLEEVLDANAVPRPSVETGHHRTLATVFGEVDVERRAYRRRGHENLHLADALLNLPAEKHSHGLRRWAAIEGARGSFDAAVEAIERATGQQVGKRQVESLAQRAAVDVDAFYAQRSGRQTNPEDVLVISVDGKGIVMRPDALRAGTRRASEASTTKLKARLSKGEKRGRKRMAELGAVYDPTSEDDEHTTDRIGLVTCGNAETAGWGRVTTESRGSSCSGGAQLPLGTVKSKNRAGSGRSRAARMAFWPLVVAERCARCPSAVARVTRCIRSSSWRRLRQVSPVAFSTTRISSRASQQSWTWPRMRSSR